MQADLVLKVIGGTSFAFQTLFGLAIAMIASAVVLSGEYRRAVLGERWWGRGLVLAGVLHFSTAPGTGRSPGR
jgi:hypothetical protein